MMSSAGIYCLVDSHQAMLDAARRGPEKMEWAAAKDALVTGFDIPATTSSYCVASGRRSSELTWIFYSMP
ncbi:unnamed protein product [Echinostoma caproni]|uniref:Nitrate reductase n=1 Tax=Echinostoma caproni TaxID=27848 RepID=A0A183A612_9TREM|nr:unnamed protein product [Echinostoma caproni]